MRRFIPFLLALLIVSGAQAQIVLERQIKAATATGALSYLPFGAIRGAATHNSVAIGGGYGFTGCTISAAGNIQANGTLTIDSTSALTGAVTIGNGYSGTGSTLGATGAAQFKGALTVDTTSILTGAVRFGTAATAGLLHGAGATNQKKKGSKT